MIRGTTPTLEFEFPFDIEMIDTLSIVLCQYRKIIVEKGLEDCKAEGKTLTLKLSQAETLKFREDVRTEIQVRAKTYDGTALASDIISEDTHRILKDGEI